jgi:hypothetical protein
MSLVYVSEFPGLAGTDQGDSVPILAVPALASYTVVVSGGVSEGPPLNAATKFVELSCDTTCSFRIDLSSGGTATLNDCRLETNERIVRRVPYQSQAVVIGEVLALKQYAVFTTANA